MSISDLNFFASANSGRGFVSFYEEIFKGLKKHYIIKGGPGTGKSSLMKAVAKEAEKRTMTVEKFYCSSDPNSFDGIIIKELSVGITDGTSPHTADPKYPGLTDEIINLSDYWNKNILKDYYEQIVFSADQKKQLYIDTYLCLNAALTMDTMIQRALLNATDTQALCSLARSYTEVLPIRRGKTCIRLIDGITMKGYRKFEPYKNEANIVYNLKDTYGIGHLFLSHILKILYDCEVTVSYDALDSKKVNMLYLPTDKILFILNGNCGEEIYLDDFISSSFIPHNTAMTRKESLMSDAYSLLAKIEKEHFELEKIYISAMDFALKEEYQNKLIKELFS